MSRAWCIVDDAPILGGAELFALRLAQALRDRGDEVTIATPRDGALAAVAADADITVCELRLPRLKARNAAAVPAGVWNTRRLLADMRGSQTIVVANTAGAQAYCAVAAASLRGGVSLVHLVHEQMTSERRSAQFVLRRSPAVVANGANTLAAYEAALGRTDIGKLNNFVDVEALSAGASPSPRETTATLPIVGILARMTPEKGIIEAVEELHGAEEAWSEASIGGPIQDPAYGEAVAARIEALGLAGRIRLHGQVEVLPFLDSVDVLLVPSTGTEGLPTVILEGLGRGRPVVVRSHMASTDFTGLPVVPYTDASDLAAALTSLPTIDAAIRSEVVRRFGPEQAIAALEAAVASAA